MIAHTEYLTIRTATRYEIRDITGEVERVRAAAGLDDGFVLVSTMHITSSIFVNDHESGLWSDILTWVDKLAPSGLDYKHHLTGEDNGDAFLRRKSVVILFHLHELVHGDAELAQAELAVLDREVRQSRRAARPQAPLGELALSVLCQLEPVPVEALHKLVDAGGRRQRRDVPTAREKAPTRPTIRAAR